jgi:glycosyltransferase involved in cell wall biosynthesis
LSRPIHILHVFSSFGLGGPQGRFAALTEHLGDEFRHTVVAADGNYEAKARLAPAVVVDFESSPPSSTWAGTSGFSQLLRRLRPDLLQTYNWGSTLAVAAGLLTRVCPIIHHEHGFGPEEAVQRFRRRRLARSVLLRHVHLNILASQTLLRIALEEYRLPRAKVRWISNGVNLRRFVPSRDTWLRDRLGVSPDTLLIGSGGGFRGEKRVDFLVRAFAAARLDNARLVLIGEPDQAKSALALAQSLGAGGKVLIHPRLADPRPLYAAFDIYAMSSVTEQMPMALLEAMSCYLPVIATAAGDTAHIVGSIDGLQVHPIDDLDGYTAALRRQAQDPQLRAQLGAANRARCEKEFSFDAMAEAYREVYRNAVRRGRP